MVPLYAAAPLYSSSLPCGRLSTANCARSRVAGHGGGSGWGLFALLQQPPLSGVRWGPGDTANPIGLYLDTSPPRRRPLFHFWPAGPTLGVSRKRFRNLSPLH